MKGGACFARGVRVGPRTGGHASPAMVGSYQAGPSQPTRHAAAEIEPTGSPELYQFYGATSRCHVVHILDEDSNHNPRNYQTHESTRERERPLGRLTLALQERAHDHHATLPAVVLVKRKNVAGGEQEIQPAKCCAEGQHAGDDVEDDSAKMYEELSPH